MTKDDYPRSLRVLVVDDMDFIADLFALILRNAGHDVRSRTKGFADLLTDDLSEVDVVCCDLMLPEVGGLAILRRIRQDHPGVRLVVLTAAASETSLHAAAASMADVVLDKPCDPDVLLAAVEGHAP